jgi:hypothetical protein
LGKGSTRIEGIKIQDRTGGRILVDGIPGWDEGIPDKDNEKIPGWDEGTETKDVSYGVDYSSEHPDVTTADRAFLQAFSGNPEVIARYYKDRNFDAKAAGGNVLLRKPGEGKYQLFDSPDATWKDIVDIPADVGLGVAAGIGGVLGTFTGVPVAGPIGGAMVATEGVEAARQGLGKLMGIPTTGGEIAKSVANEGLLAGSGEGVGLGIAKGGKALLGKLSKPAIQAEERQALSKMVLEEAERQRLSKQGILRKEVEGVVTPEGKAPTLFDMEGKRQAETEAMIAANRGKRAINEDLRTTISKDVEQELKDSTYELNKVKNKYRIGTEETPAPKAVAPEATEQAVRREIQSKVKGIPVPTDPEIDTMLATSGGGKIPFLSQIMHPAYGIKADALKRAPGLINALNDALPGIVRAEGSFAMDTRSLLLKLAEKRLSQEEANQVGKKLAHNIAEWGRSAEGDSISLAYRESLDRLSSGKPTQSDIAVINDIITRATRKPQDLKEALERYWKAVENMSGERAKKAGVAKATEGQRRELVNKIEQSRLEKEKLSSRIQSERRGLTRDRKLEQLIALEKQGTLNAQRDKMQKLGVEFDPSGVAMMIPNSSARAAYRVLSAGAYPLQKRIKKGSNWWMKNVESKVLPEVLRNRHFASRMGAQTFRALVD